MKNEAKTLERLEALETSDGPSTGIARRVLEAVPDYPKDRLRSLLQGARNIKVDRELNKLMQEVGRDA
ncbi:MAG: hypothetical protein K9L68_12980 [Spirochaetales bacterium]|nr:hypothetical protein [Spirochaetales bacterium]